MLGLHSRIALRPGHDTSRKGTRRGLPLGLMVGVVATLALVTVGSGVTQVLLPGPRTFTTTCSGANVTGTIWLADSDVFNSIAVVDPKARGWKVRWDYYDDVAGEKMPEASGFDYSGGLVSGTQALGDTDGGTHRSAQVRPQGQRAWCTLDMHVSLLW